jgi:formiminotetrahydrofolate cyclodeaminase
MAAGLAHMVAAMSRSKKASLQYESQLSVIVPRLAQLREDLKTAIDADADSYNTVMKAFKQSQGDGDAAITAALKGATNVPLSVAERASELARVIEELKPITNPKMASDLSVAASLCRAALEGAIANVEINLGDLKDPGFISEVRARVSSLRA